MRGGTMFWVFLGAVIAIGVWLVSLYNSMVKRKNHVEDGWSGIDVQLKRRHNLIPNHTFLPLHASTYNLGHKK